MYCLHVSRLLVNSADSAESASNGIQFQVDIAIMHITATVWLSLAIQCVGLHASHTHMFSIYTYTRSISFSFLLTDISFLCHSVTPYVLTTFHWIRAYTCFVSLVNMAEYLSTLQTIENHPSASER